MSVNTSSARSICGEILHRNCKLLLKAEMDVFDGAYSRALQAVSLRIEGTALPNTVNAVQLESDNHDKCTATKLTHLFNL